MVSEWPVWHIDDTIGVSHRIYYPANHETEDMFERAEQPATLFMFRVSPRGRILEGALFPISYLGFRGN